MEKQNTQYAVITKKFDEETAYYLVSAEEIKTMNLSDTYGGFGQSIDTAEAGDSIELDTEKAAQIAQKASDETVEEGEYTWAKGDVISAYDCPDVYDEILEALKKEAKEDGDYTMYLETVKGFNYWDGSNFASIIVEADSYEAPYQLEDDEELISAINKAVAKKELEKDLGTGKQYRGGDFVIMTSYWQGTWYAYKVMLAEDYYMENQQPN